MNTYDIELIAEPQSLNGGDTGSIWGKVYFRVGESYFPQKGWDDMAVAFARAWLNQLLAMAREELTTTSVSFYDGPWRVDLKQVNGQLTANFLHKQTELYTLPVRLESLLENARSIAIALVTEATARGWHDNDVSAIETALSISLA